jgi:hypothetical protein
LRVQYRSLAQAYDRLADDEERAAGNLKLHKSRAVRKDETPKPHMRLRRRRG